MSSWDYGCRNGHDYRKLCQRLISNTTLLILTLHDFAENEKNRRNGLTPLEGKAQSRAALAVRTSPTRDRHRGRPWRGHVL